MKRKFTFIWSMLTLLVATFLVILSSGCPSGNNSDSSLSPGNVTIHITDASDQNGTEVFVGIANQGEDPAIYDNQIGGPPLGDQLIVNGEYEVVVREHESETIAVYDGGQYELGVLLDVVIPVETGTVDSGDYTVFETFTVDGNTVIDLSYPSDFDLVP